MYVSCVNMQIMDSLDSPLGDMTRLSEPSAVYRSSADVISAIRSGIRREEVLDFCKRIGRSLAGLAKVLPASYSLLTKRDVYDAQVSERVMQIADLYSTGIKVFGAVERLNTWLDTPAPQVHGQRPFDLLDTAYGVDLVKRWLHRIDHGLPI